METFGKLKLWFARLVSARIAVLEAQEALPAPLTSQHIPSALAVESRCGWEIPSAGVEPPAGPAQQQSRSGHRWTPSEEGRRFRLVPHNTLQPSAAQSFRVPTAATLLGQCL
ncbi:hypothetical protein AV530_004303 [Patagioenas fasciata monilis]|uniref:Uncharacterized protein n=1 Tax=Patagioenas fasciata monilis TaxID=372326 RepID=A0A1V4K8Y0_PATFA|nr:hypothetical protein AV530_004303 [Patagioenas fasciata monilis]